MQAVTTIGLDIAKSVFQVHGVDCNGQVVIRRQLKRRYVLAFFEKLAPCLIGIEACASSHHWSRQLLALGHDVRLMPPRYVKPYVKRQKNDATDAEAICEAVSRTNMRFVPTKTPEQQSALVLHRTTAPALFVLLWSTGFIGARYGMPYIEPLTFLAVRMGFAVVIMAAIALLAGARWPNANEIGHSLVAGSLVHGLTLGGVFTAISQGVPAGISALILGLQPIVTSTLANRFMGEKITRLQSVGLALGLVGVLLVLHDRNIVLAGSVLGWVASFF